MSAPFMQLYVADYLGDTRHLTTEQHGAYLLLLMTMWRSGGRLPNDAKKLARIAGCTPSRWAKIADDVLEFFDVDGDEITNARLTLELEKASEKSIKRAEAGTKGGKAKALKNNDAGLTNAKRMTKHSSEPEPYVDTDVSTARGARSHSQADFDQFWAAYPAKVGKKAAERAWRSAKDRPPLSSLLEALDRYRRTKPADRDWCNPATWLNQGRWMDGEPEANDTPASGPTFAGPAKLREAIAEKSGEPYARSYVDPCRWDADNRRLIAANPYALEKLTRDHGDLARAWKFAIVVEADNDANPVSHGEAA